MKLKKLFALAVCVTMSFSVLAACGDTEDDEDTKGSTAAQSDEDEETEEERAKRMEKAAEAEEAEERGETRTEPAETEPAETEPVEEEEPEVQPVPDDGSKEFNGHYYKAIDDADSYSQSRAESVCAEMGGHLVSIESQEEQDFVNGILGSKDNYWIGLVRDGSSWRWTDGTEFSFTQWDDNQPDNYENSEDAVRLAARDIDFGEWSCNGGYWLDTNELGDNDAPLSSFGYIIEWESQEDHLAYLVGNNTTAPTQKAEIEDLISFGGHYYKVYDNANATQTECENKCAELGGHLVSIESQAEQDFVNGILGSSENYWIGLVRAGSTWRWTDGTSFSFTQWDDNQPDNYQDSENAVRLAAKDIDFGEWSCHGGYWLDTNELGDNDAPLSSFGYICEWTEQP